MKVCTIVGTRPELIRLSEIIKTLDERTDHVLVHTGQNYDPKLRDVFYDDLELRQPNYALDCAGNSLAETLGNCFLEIESIFDTEKPDAVVILGDTNSALTGIIAKRRKIPFFHLEAGNRCFDDNVPEEINRRLLDHIADVNLVYTDRQREYLLSEGIAKDRLFVMGSPIREVLTKHYGKIEASTVLKRLKLGKDGYFLVSLHRDENIEIPENFAILCDTLNSLAEQYNLPIIVTTHPRLRMKLKDKNMCGNIHFMEPFGFLDYNKLQENAKCVISDSGTIAEESAMLGFRAVTIRNAIERPEAFDAGSLLMSGVDQENILKCVELARTPTSIPAEYGTTDCANRVVNIILSFTPYVNKYVWRKR